MRRDGEKKKRIGCERYDGRRVSAPALVVSRGWLGYVWEGAKL